MHGRLEVTARDLSRFAASPAAPSRARRASTADLDGAPSYGALTATIDAQATRLATAYPMLDRVTGGELRLTGAARSTAGGGFGFTDLVASGAHGSAKLNGDFGRDKVNLDASVDVPQASVLDPRVSGKAQVVATLTGVPDDLSATLKATLGDGRLLDRKTSGLTLEAQASPHHRAARGEGVGLGRHRRPQACKPRPMSRRPPTADGAPTISRSRLASARLAGEFAVGADQLATGELSFSATNLDDLSPLVLTRMSGALQAKVSASAADGRQAVAIAASSEQMAFGANTVRRPQGRPKVGDFGARGASPVSPGSLALKSAGKPSPTSSWPRRAKAIPAISTSAAPCAASR